jgi:hypothetical protein
MPKPQKDRKAKPTKTERDSIKATLRAHGWRDADLAALDDAADRESMGERVVEMQRRAPKASNKEAT